MNEAVRPIVVFFYCQNTPGADEGERQALEKKFGTRIRLFPIPCGGRFEPVHVLKALEAFADAVYVITCPEGFCKYFEGNLRAKKRMARAKDLLQAIGLERERAELYMRSPKDGKKLVNIVEELLAEASKLSTSPVFKYVGRQM